MPDAQTKNFPFRDGRSQAYIMAALNRDPELSFKVRKAGEGYLENDDRPSIDFVKFENSVIKDIRTLFDANNKTEADKFAAEFGTIQNQFMRYDQIKSEGKKEYNSLTTELLANPNHTVIESKIQTHKKQSDEILQLYQNIKTSMDDLNNELKKALRTTPANSSQRRTPDD